MEANGSRAQIFAFNDCELDTGRGSLRRGNAEIRLRPKSFEVLEYLVRHAGRLVGKRELLDAVWGQRVVTEDSLTQCIVEIRRAIGCSPAAPYLRTVPRRGYLLDVMAREMTAPRSQPDRLHDQPPTRVALAPLWRVAAALVAAMSLLAVGSTTQLHAGRSVPVNDAASSAANGQAGPGQEAFLLGKHLFHRRLPGDLAAAERQLQRALALDPSNADAWTALAGVYAARGFEEHGDPSRRLDEQRAALERALRIAPAHPEALVRLSRVLRLAGDSAGAAAAIRTALASAPGHPLVLYARASKALARGRLEEAIELRQQAVQANPVSAVYRNNLGLALLGAGRHEEALVQLRRAQLLSPTAAQQGSIGQALVAGGRFAEARGLLQSMPDSPKRDQLLALVAQDAAEAEAAEMRLANRADYGSALLLAEIAAYRGLPDIALRHLQQAVEHAEQTGCGATQQVIDDAVVSPFLQGLRTDHRWPWRDRYDIRAG